MNSFNTYCKTIFVFNFLVWIFWNIEIFKLFLVFVELCTYMYYCIIYYWIYYALSVTMYEIKYFCFIVLNFNKKKSILFYYQTQLHKINCWVWKISKIQFKKMKNVYQPKMSGCIQQNHAICGEFDNLFFSLKNHWIFVHGFIFE